MADCGCNVRRISDVDALVHSPTPGIVSDMTRTNWASGLPAVSGSFANNQGDPTAVVAGDYGTVIGGQGGSVTNFGGTVAGGLNSVNDGRFAAMLGGSSNTINALGVAAAMVGGQANLIDGTTNGTIVGGQVNTLGPSATHSGIFAGTDHIVTVGTSAIVGGAGHSLTGGANGFMGGGSLNGIGGRPDSAIVAGQGHYINATSSFIAGGNTHSIFGSASAIVGGEDQAISSSFASDAGRDFIGGGRGSIISLTSGTGNSAIIGGSDHILTGSSSGSLVAGGSFGLLINSSASAIIAASSAAIERGEGNVIVGGAANLMPDSTRSAIVGGRSNLVDGSLRSGIFVGGGNDDDYFLNQIIDSTGSAIIGGDTHTIDRGVSFSEAHAIVGGRFHTIDGFSGSAIVAGRAHTVSGNSSVIAGGGVSVVEGDDSAVIGGIGHSTGIRQEVVIAGGSLNSVVGTARAFMAGGRDNVISTPGGDSLDYDGSIIGSRLGILTDAGLASLLGTVRCTIDSTRQGAIVASADSRIGNLLGTQYFNSAIMACDEVTVQGTTCAVVGSTNTFVEGRRNVAAGGTLHVLGDTSVSPDPRHDNFIGGGDSNSAQGNRGAVIGGDSNSILSGGGFNGVNRSGIVAGLRNTVSANDSVIAGGIDSVASHVESFMCGSAPITTGVRTFAHGTGSADPVGFRGASPVAAPVLAAIPAPTGIPGLDAWIASVDAALKTQGLAV